MPTVRSWTEDWRRAVTDTGHLLRFRFGAVRGGARRWLLWLAPLPLLLTAFFAVVPAWLPQAGADSGYARGLLILLPVATGVFLVLTVMSAVASGGGRELLPRDQGVAYPVGEVTDHLGALLLAPLNVAWLVQAWATLAMASYAAGPAALLPAQAMVLLFLAFGTALGQVIGWLVEALRRGPHGLVLHRGLVALVLGTAVWVAVADLIVPVLEASPTVHLAIGIGQYQLGEPGRLLAVTVVLAVLTVVLVVGGVGPARLALGRMPRDEARLETGFHRPRRHPRSDLGVLVRTDLASVLRSVPLRRGLLTLSLLPGLMAMAGAIDWGMLVLLPGLVASGGTLLFGVNAWCLDGRGALWRESLPVHPGQAFLARTAVLVGLLLGASGLTVVLGGVRAGSPAAAEVTALLCAWVVVCVQVVASSMSWSLHRPYAVDLRSARATPAPPVVMMGYSARLAFSTTFVGMAFAALATTPWAWAAPLVALPLLGWAAARLRRVHRRWLDPDERAGVVVTVAA